MTSAQPFIGKEAEGPGIGITTLFIPKGSPKSIGYNEFFQKVISLSISRLYFGAGDKKGLTEEDLILIDKLLHHSGQLFKILIECSFTDLEELKYMQDRLGLYITDNPGVEVVVVIPTNDHTKFLPVQHIKFVGQTGLLWFPVKTFHITSLSDELYNTDKIFPK